jgi:hypothetical protein
MLISYPFQLVRNWFIYGFVKGYPVLCYANAIQACVCIYSYYTAVYYCITRT